ncbi:hypothetical protein [Rhodococcus rhodochrous]|uniref:hypothetical protein n=1 Tax=Rhodococcus rhodochrous TaxID=1829 RepID=UPI000AE14483|nr:hypothetical protein [Rhodococcus rhodochrous]
MSGCSGLSRTIQPPSEPDGQIEQIEQFPAQPSVSVCSAQSLGLSAPGVIELDCKDADAAYPFRYDGLKLILPSGDQYLLLPVEWSRDTGVAFLLPRSEAIRTDFSPAEVAPPPHGVAERPRHDPTSVGLAGPPGLARRHECSSTKMTPASSRAKGRANLSINAPVSEDALEDVDERPGLADEGEFDRQQHRVFAAHVVALPAVGKLAGHLFCVVAVDTVEEFGQLADGQLDGSEGGIAGLGCAGNGLGESVAEVTEEPAVDVVGVLAAGGGVVAGHSIKSRAESGT